MGSLCVKCMEQLNSALLTKLGWIVHAASDKLWVQAIKAKYMPYNFIWDNTVLPTDSWFWKGVHKTAPILRKGMCFQILRGDDVRVWQDP